MFIPPHFVREGQVKHCGPWPRRIKMGLHGGSLFQLVLTFCSSAQSVELFGTHPNVSLVDQKTSVVAVRLILFSDELAICIQNLWRHGIQ